MIRKLGIALGAIATVLVLTVLAWLEIAGAVWASRGLYGVVAALGQLGTVLLVCLLLPNAPIPSNRHWTGRGIVVVSYVWGAGLWMWATLVLYGLWGFVGMLLGFALLRLGSVPLACVALIFAGQYDTVGSLVLAAAAVFAVRLLGKWIESKAPSARVSSTVTAEGYATSQGFGTERRQPSSPDVGAGLVTESDVEVWEAYGEFLTRTGEDRNLGSIVLVRRESELPFAKERIRKALLNLQSFVIRARAEGHRPPSGSIEGPLNLLDTFVPESEVQPTMDLLNRVVSVARPRKLAEVVSLLKSHGCQDFEAVLSGVPEFRRQAVEAVLSGLLLGQQTPEE